VRAILAGERTTIAAARVQHLCKVEVADADGTYQDWSAYLMSATWGEHIDQPVAQATIKLRRAAGTSSLAPTMVGSPLNRNSLAAYAAALDVGRLVRISTATINPGDTPTYREMFSGRIDDIDWAADPIAITCSDLGAFLMDTQIEVERDYWSTDGTMVLSALTTGDHGTTLAVLVESVMGKLLADTPNGITSPALYTPASPGWRINPYKQDKVKVLEAVRALGQQIGWDVRYRYDASHASRLTFIDPSRSSTTVAATIAPTEYKDVKKLAIALADVRNAGLVAYLDTGSVRHEVTASDTASIAKYGRRYMQLEPGQNIDTDTEATAYITAAVSDLSGAPAEQDVELLYFWPVQLFDRYTFTANGDHYDTDQTLAVTAYSHTFEHGEGTTTLTCAGRVIGSFADWLKRQGPADTPASDPARSITRVVATETTDGTARNFVVTIGGEVDTVHVHYRTVPIAAIGDVFDFSGDEDTTVSPSLLILPRTAGSDTISFSLPHPSRGFKIAARMVPHTAPPGYFEGGNWPVQIDAAPPAVNAKIHPARVGAVASLSIDIAFGVSDGPVTVDVMEDTFTTSTTILTATMTAPATIDNITNAALGNRALPPGKDSLQWRVRITDVSGQAFWFGPASANRDPLANGTVTVVDYRANPSFVCAFDQDTDVITIRTHSGKVKTFNRAALDAAGSPVTWNATDATDDATSDPALTVDVVSTGYTVKYTGGGTDSLIWSGSLHGQPSNPPTADIRTDPNANRDAADVRIRPDTQVGEKLFVYYRDGSTNAALQWIACVSAGDPTALQVVAGTQLGPANFFRRVDGVGSPVAKLSAIPLARDQVLKNGAMIQGVDSGIQSPWLDVVLSVMEKPWNEAFDLAWDEATGNVVATVSAGAHVLFETVQIADNALFVSPTTQTVAIADGTTAKLTFALSQAQRGKTWYGRAKPNNNGSGTGLDGEYQYAVVPVPAVFTLQPSVAETTTQGTLTLVVSDPGSVLNAAWTNGTITTPIHFEVQRLGVKTIEAPTTLPGGGATTGTYTKVITLLDHPVTLLGFAHMIDGSVRAIGAWTFDSNKVSDLVNGTVANNGTTATVTVRWDTDALVGANCARYSLNGGTSYTTVTVDSQLLTQFDVTRTASKQTVLVQAKNAIDGAWGNVSVVEIDAYVSEGPSFDVHLVEHATTTDVYWSCSSGVATLSIDGGTASTPGASPITVTRPAAGGVKLNYKFAFTLGGQTITDAVDVLPIDADTATPNLSVTPGTPTATTQPYTVTFSNPKSGGSAPTGSVTCTGCTMTIGGTTYVDGTTQAITTGAVVTANRPIGATATQSKLKVDAAISGGGSESIVLEVTPQTVVATPTGTVSVDSNGVYSWTSEGASNATQARWSASTSAFPVDATVVTSGTLLTGARTFSVTSAGSLSFGQTAFITVAFFDAGNNLLSIAHFRGAYQTYSGSKTTTFSPSSWEDVTDTSVRNVPPAHLGTGEFLIGIRGGQIQHFQFQPVIPDGVTLTAVSVYLGWSGAGSGAVTSATVYVYRRTATVASSFFLGSTTFTVGSQQTKTIALNESTTGNSYYVDVAINNYTQASGLPDMYLGSVAVTYTMGDPKKTV
jgi:hypothetical protein